MDSGKLVMSEQYIRVALLEIVEIIFKLSQTHHFYEKQGEERLYVQRIRELEILIPKFVKILEHLGAGFDGYEKQAEDDKTFERVSAYLYLYGRKQTIDFLLALLHNTGEMLTKALKLEVTEGGASLTDDSDRLAEAVGFALAYSRSLWYLLNSPDGKNPEQYHLQFIKIIGDAINEKTS